MWWSTTFGVSLALALLGSVAYGGDEGRTPPAATSGLDLSVHGRALGVLPDSTAGASLGLEPERAPTGAGSLRMPSATTELGRGVYVSVMPSCIPGMDDGLPLRRRGLPVRR